MEFARRIPFWGLLALLIYMPFHTFLSQSLSLTTGGVEAWKVGKDLMLFLLLLFTICLVWRERLLTKTFKLLLALGVAYGVLHLLIWIANPDLFQQSAALSLIYNNRLPAFVLLGFGAALLNRSKFGFSSLTKIVVTLGTIVAALGVVQYFLPPDILTHFGYSLERGVHPAFFIDNNPNLLRIMSTLREPNSLGAYLMLPTVLLAATILLETRKSVAQKTMLYGLFLLHLLAICLTFSRSAWLGTILAVGILLFWVHGKTATAIIRRFWAAVVLSVVGVVLILFAIRPTQFIETYFIHSDDQSSDRQSSTDLHASYVLESVADVLERPLGYGPGTAGPTSLHNPEGAQITENYYLQIAYEVGIIGLFLFICINVIVYRRLQRQRSVLSRVLIVCFWGYVATNMFLHTWGNEAVAAQWWLLAGAVIGMGSKKLNQPVAKASGAS